jgi:hypothetical protein
MDCFGRLRCNLPFRLWGRRHHLDARTAKYDTYTSADADACSNSSTVADQHIDYRSEGNAEFR